MIARPGHWYRVKFGMYIRDLNGKTWRIDDLGDRTVTLADRDGKHVTMDRPRAGKEVIIVEPTEADALKTVQELLEAVVIEEVTK